MCRYKACSKFILQADSGLTRDLRGGGVKLGPFSRTKSWESFYYFTNGKNIWDVWSLAIRLIERMGCESGQMIEAEERRYI